MSTNAEDQRYLDACKIVEAYERAVRGERDELSVLMMMESNLDFMEEILESSGSALNQMDIVDDNPAPDRGVEAQVSEQEQAEVQNKDQNSCQEDKEFVSLDGATLNFNASSNVEIDASVPFVDPANAIDSFFGGDGDITAEDVRNSARECFDCDLKAKFDFEIKPINLMAELLPLINNIGAILDNLINELKPFDLLANLCNMSKGLKLFCLPDILSVLVTLEGLINRYIGEAFKLALNWTFLIGPIVKGIVDIAATLMEQIRRLLVAPLDCAAGFVGTILNFNTSLQGATDNLVAFASSFPEYNHNTKDRILDRTMKFVPQPELNDVGNLFRKNDKEPAPGAESNLTYGWEFSVSDTLESSYAKQKLQIKAKRKLEKRKRAIEKLNKDPRKAQSILEKAVSNINSDLTYREESPTEMELNAIQEEFGRLAEQENQGMLKNLLFMINEGKAWINSLHANLLLSLKALNGLVANNLEISFKLGGWILMIFDTIKVVQLIVHFFQGGNFKNLCDVMENDPEKLKDILDRDFKWAAVDLEQTQKKLNDWEESVMLFASQEELITCE